MKKRTLLSIVIGLLLLTTLIFAVACGPKKVETSGWKHPENYKTGAVQTGTAFALYTTIMNNWKASDGVAVVENLFFNGDAGIGGKVRQYEKTFTKVEGTKLLRTKGTYATDGNTKDNTALSKFYYDGKEGFTFKQKNKDLISRMPGETPDAGLSAMDFSGFKFKAFDSTEFDGNTLSEQVAEYKTIFSYIISEATFSAANDNQVYKLGDKLYFALTLKTEKGLQTDVEKVLYSNTGGAEDSLKFTTETVIYFEVITVGGKQVISAYEMVENYEFKKPVTVKVAQTMSGVYMYGDKDFKILPADLLA